MSTNSSPVKARLGLAVKASSMARSIRPGPLLMICRSKCFPAVHRGLAWKHLSGKGLGRPSIFIENPSPAVQSGFEPWVGFGRRGERLLLAHKQRPFSFAFPYGRVRPLFIQGHAQGLWLGLMSPGCLSATRPSLPVTGHRSPCVGLGECGGIVWAEHPGDRPSLPALGRALVASDLNRGTHKEARRLKRSECASDTRLRQPKRLTGREGAPVYGERLT